MSDACRLQTYSMDYGSEVLKRQVAIRFTEDRHRPWYSGTVVDFDGHVHLIKYCDGEQRWHSLSTDESLGQLRWLDGDQPTETPKRGRGKATVPTPSAKRSKAQKTEEGHEWPAAGSEGSAMALAEVGGVHRSTIHRRRKRAEAAAALVRAESAHATTLEMCAQCEPQATHAPYATLAMHAVHKPQATYATHELINATHKTYAGSMALEEGDGSDIVNGCARCAHTSPEDDDCGACTLCSRALCASCLHGAKVQLALLNLEAPGDIWDDEVICCECSSWTPVEVPEAWK